MKRKILSLILILPYLYPSVHVGAIITHPEKAMKKAL